MAELRTSFLTEEARLYGDEREQTFGVPIQDRQDPGERTAGFLKSLAQGFAVDGLGYARDQWGAIKDTVMDPDTRTLTPERYEELRTDPFRGKIDVPFEAGISERQFRTRLRLFKRNEAMNQYSRSAAGHTTRFLGNMGGGMAAPEVLGTIWVGGPAFGAAARATTMGNVVKNSLVGSTQVAAATTPLNVVAQDAVYGRVDPTETFMTAAAPYAFAPIGVAFSRAFTTRESAAVAEAGANEAPTPTPEPRDMYVPADFRAEFDGYEGGVERWIDDIAQNNENAFEYGRSVGLTDEALGELKQRTFVESSRTPIDPEEVQDLDALEAYAGNQNVTPEQIARLERRGLVDTAAETRAAAETPDFARTPEQQLSLRALNERRADIEGRLPEVVDALRYRDYLRAGARNGTEVDPQTPVSGSGVLQTGGKAIPSSRITAQAQQLQEAVLTRDADLAPQELRGAAEEMIAVADVDANTQRVAYRREAELLKVTNEAATGDVKAQKKFAERMIQKLPEHAEGDYKALRSNGYEGVAARFVQRKIDEANELTARLGAMEESRRGKKGRPPKAFTELQTLARQRLAEVDALVDATKGRATRPPKQVTVDDIADILAASRLKRGKPGVNEKRADTDAQDQTPTQREERPADRAEQDPATEEQLDEILAYAKANGVEVDEIQNSYSAAAKAIVECPV